MCVVLEVTLGFCAFKPLETQSDFPVFHIPHSLQEYWPLSGCTQSLGARMRVTLYLLQGGRWTQSGLRGLPMEGHNGSLAVVCPASGLVSVSPMHTSLLLSPLIVACDITGCSQKAALCS